MNVEALKSPPKVISITIDGYKHAMVPVIALSIAYDQPIKIANAPLVTDTKVLSEIICEGGGLAQINKNSFS